MTKLQENERKEKDHNHSGQHASQIYAVQTEIAYAVHRLGSYVGEQNVFVESDVEICLFPPGEVVVTLDGGVTEPRVALRHTLLIKAHLTEKPLPLVHRHDVAARLVEQLRVSGRTLLLVVAGPRGRLYVRKLLGLLLT